MATFQPSSRGKALPGRHFAGATLCRGDALPGRRFAGGMLCQAMLFLGDALPWRRFAGVTLYRGDALPGRRFARATLCRGDALYSMVYTSVISFRPNIMVLKLSLSSS